MHWSCFVGKMSPIWNRHELHILNALYFLLGNAGNDRSTLGVLEQLHVQYYIVISC